MSRFLGFALRAAAAVRLRLRAVTALATARGRSRRRLAGSAPRHVLVVCYGNIYRSAFVGVFLQERLKSLDVEVRSAGFHPVAGRPSPARHVELSGKYGVSLAEHRSVVVTRDDLAWADLIVLMDRHNWARLIELQADAKKLVWLGSLVAGPVELPDPYTLSDVEAERIVARMREAAQQLAGTIERASGSARLRRGDS